MTFYNILAVGFGGMAGSIARYCSVMLIDKRLNPVFPYGTLAVNILGSFVLGCIIGLNLKGSLSENVRLLLATGFCGGFTTFSAFAYENISLMNQKTYGSAISYIVVSIVLGLVAVWSGMAISKPHQ
jgi:fluoride exporter